MMLKWWAYFLTEAFWILCAPRRGGQSRQQGAANSISNQERNTQTAQTGMANTQLGGANQQLQNTQDSLNQFEGPVQESPFYKALLTSGMEGTSAAYNNAKANTAERARMAGFGYSQPVAQGAQDQLGAQEAGALAEQPAKAMTEAVQPELAATGQSAGIGRDLGAVGAEYANIGNQYGQQGLGYFDAATQMQNRRPNWGTNADEVMKVAGGLGGALLGI